jgi:ribosomal protein L16 Arg81 hydroxylase
MNFKKLLDPPTEPIVVRNGIGHWPALKKWTWPYLQTLAGKDEVRLVQGNREQQQTQFVNMPLTNYIQYLLQPDVPKSEDLLYLKEFDLFQKFPALQEDVDYTNFFPWWVTPAQGAWIGPEGAMTGLHYDIFNNFLIQVVGMKEIWFYPQSVIPQEYRSTKFDYGARDATVNMFDIDFEQFPRLQGVEPRIELVHPGDVVLIPKGWWHQVRALTPTITIANFMVRVSDRFSVELWENIRRSLHNKGLYKARNCTCHSAETR